MLFRGSTFVEAAIVFPIVLLVIFLLLKNGMLLCEKNGAVIADDRQYAEEIRRPGLSAEGVLRVKWLGEKAFSEND